MPLLKKYYRYYYLLYPVALLFCMLPSGLDAQRPLAEMPITIDNGLVNNEVTAIHQDKYGFLWLGTRGGLNRYNGYDFDLIRYAPGSTNNLSNQAVEVIAEDQHHTIWIGTKNGGLNSYDLLKDSILHYYPPDDINIQEIKSLAVDAKGRLFIGALHGLYIYEKGHFTVVNKQLTIYAIAVDKRGMVWTGTSMGLQFFDEAAMRLKRVDIGRGNHSITSLAISEKKNTIYAGTWSAGLLIYDYLSGSGRQIEKGDPLAGDLEDNDTYRVYLDRSQDLWIGTWGGGLYKLDRQTEQIRKINIKPEDNYTTDYDIVLSIEQDAAGILWVGTDGGGLCKIDPFKKEFHSITHLSDNRGLPNTHVTAVFEDRKGGLWMGTRGGGLSYSSNKKDFTRIAPNYGGDIVRAFMDDEGRDLWVGTTLGLLIFKNYSSGISNPLWVKRGNSGDSLSGPKITSIVKDKNNTIWVGTQEHGLNRVLGFRNGMPFFKQYPEKLGTRGALQNDRVSCLLVDKDNRLWVGTYDGLHLYDRNGDDFMVLRHEMGNPNSISDNTILCMTQDQTGNIWVGTQRGLNKIRWTDPQHYKVENYFQGPGFPNDYVHSVQVDKYDNVWLCTNRGICKYNVKEDKFSNFDTRDGVASNTFSENASFKSPDGQLFFGGIAGLTYFYPDSIRLNRYQPALYITNIKINNKDIQVGQKLSKKVILSETVFLTKQIKLTYNEDIITLSFAALDFHAPDKNQYQYQLNGFDRHWVNAGNRRTVTYTNLPAGTYVFRVRASNSDQIWDNSRQQLEITVLPPPWKTWWAYSLYALLILGILGLSRYITISRLRLQNKLAIADLNYKNEHEIAELKTRFFANISHEFRTPLTLMIGPLEGVSQSDKVDPSLKSVLKKVQHQSKRLLSLVNQLLDFNKAENDRLSLSAADLDIIALMRSVYESFVDEAERKRIRFQFVHNSEMIYVHGDKDKLESIGYNLLSNAFKFTPAEGEISLVLRLNDVADRLDMIVSDSGPGIKEEDKLRVFDRFYQVLQNEPGRYAGTGIGLAFVKDLVELHGGSISIEDRKPQGTNFILQLPAVKHSQPSYNNKEENKVATEQLLPAESVAKTEEGSIILVVEDNEELNHYIAGVLQPLGGVVKTFNGKEALDKAFDLIPDLIVSDVMMPEMDGFQLCEAVKTDPRTSHIPVILLTAKTDDLSHVQGISLGADDYLAKPFTPSVLAAHVKNLIASRKKLKELFALKFSMEPGAVEVESSEEEFIRNAVRFVEEHLGEDDLSIDELAAQLHMSRSTFYRKLKGITGMSGSDFIRTIKLKRSAQLLKSGEYSVSMAAYESGFNDLKHFRKSFVQQFGLTPSDYLKQEMEKKEKS